MKFKVDQHVKFDTADGKREGRIEIADWGGSIEHDYHSYDIYVRKNNTLYKHVLERRISRAGLDGGNDSLWNVGQKVAFEAEGVWPVAWESREGTIIEKRWNESAEEYVYDIEANEAESADGTRVFKVCFLRTYWRRVSVSCQESSF